MTNTIENTQYKGMQNPYIKNDEAKSTQETEKTQDTSIYSDSNQTTAGANEAGSIFAQAEPKGKTLEITNEPEVENMAAQEEKQEDGNIFGKIIGGLVGMVTLGGVFGSAVGQAIGGNESAQEAVASGFMQGGLLGALGGLFGTGLKNALGLNDTNMLDGGAKGALSGTGKGLDGGAKDAIDNEAEQTESADKSNMNAIRDKMAKNMNELIDKINEDTDGTDSEEESEEELAQEA